MPTAIVTIDLLQLQGLCHVTFDNKYEYYYGGLPTVYAGQLSCRSSHLYAYTTKPAYATMQSVMSFCGTWRSLTAFAGRNVSAAKCCSEHGMPSVTLLLFPT